MATLNDIKKKYCIDEAVVNVMGHVIPRGIYTTLERIRSENTDQRQTGFFSDKERKNRFVKYTNSLFRYVEQNLKTADPKEQKYIQMKLNTLRKERDEIMSKLMVMKGRGK